MIVGLSTIQDKSAGFRTRLFMPRWSLVKERLHQVRFAHVSMLRIRMIIGDVKPSQDVQGFEDDLTFVVETRLPIVEFKKLTIAEKNDCVLDSIFESIKATYAHFEDTPPPEIDQIWRETRAVR